MVRTRDTRPRNRYPPPLPMITLLCAISFLAGLVDSVVGGGGLIQIPALFILLPELAPSTFGGPKTVAIRKPHNLEEKNSVLFSVLDGGRDFAERPGFYLPYEGEAALQSLNRAKPLAGFLNKFPDQADDARKIAAKADKPVEKLVYLPVVSRQDWIAILDEKATVIGFLKGDGF